MTLKLGSQAVLKTKQSLIHFIAAPFERLPTYPQKGIKPYVVHIIISGSQAIIGDRPYVELGSLEMSWQIRDELAARRRAGRKATSWKIGEELADRRRAGRTMQLRDEQVDRRRARQTLQLRDERVDRRRARLTVQLIDELDKPSGLLMIQTSQAMRQADCTVWMDWQLGDEIDELCS